MRPQKRLERGMAYILALVLLLVFVAIAVALAGLTGGGLRQTENLADVQKARWAAESGLAFALREFRNLALPSTTTSSNAISNVATALGGMLNATGNLGGSSVMQSATAIAVPWISLGQQSFQLRVVQAGDGSLTLYSQGKANAAVQTVALGVAVALSPNSAFNYGVASRGPISIGGNGEIRGKNQLTEASVISTTSGTVAVSIGGSCIIDGDISSVGAPSTVVISGNPTIAGSQNPAVMAQHVHFGVDAPVFPTVDTTVFRNLATTVIDSSTNLNVDTFTNVVIRANTNPTFSHDVIFNGVVYVEAPNNVSFTSKVTLNGLVATDPGTSLDTCKLSFGGQVEAFGVEALPNQPQFAAVKALTGTFIAAQGFDVSFGGQFATINGTVAADRLSFTGQASGTVKGSVIGLGYGSTSITGTVDIYIDRSSSATPAGFSVPMTLVTVPRTYREVVGSGN